MIVYIIYIPQFMLRWLIIVIECYRSKFDSPICWWLYQSYHLFSETFIVEHRKMMKNWGWLKNDVILPIFPVVHDFPYYWMVPSGKLTVRPWQSSGLEDLFFIENWWFSGSMLIYWRVNLIPNFMGFMVYGIGFTSLLSGQVGQSHPKNGRIMCNEAVYPKW